MTDLTSIRSTSVVLALTLYRYEVDPIVRTTETGVLIGRLGRSFPFSFLSR